MIPLKFIHTADLHLDSPFTGLRIVNPELARAAQNATFEAFEALVDYAISKKVDFFLVAGDVYDSADRSLRAQLRFCRALDRLADQGIPTFVVHGNHDPLDGWSAHLAWPQLVTIFPGDKVGLGAGGQGGPGSCPDLGSELPNARGTEKPCTRV